MLKVIIIYESKYGNTRQVAGEIFAGIRKNKGIETILREVKQVDFDDVIAADGILIGSPNHWGRHTGGIKKFIDKLGEINLNRVPVAVFDTYIKEDCGKGVKKMEQQIAEKVLSLNLITPGLSVKVNGMKGPVPEEKLPKCREFGVNFGEVVKG